MTTSDKGIELIKRFEGCRLEPYWDVDGYSVGYGHHQGVVPGQRITLQEADRLLRQDVAVQERAVDALGARLSQHQFDALVSLCYNIGSGALSRSRVAALVRQNPEPSDQLEREWKEWHLAGGQALEALDRRRAAEWELYCSDSGQNRFLRRALPLAALLLAGALAALWIKSRY